MAVDLISTGEVVLEIVEGAVRRLTNARKAGERFGNQGLARAAGEYIPSLVQVASSLSSIVELLREGRIITAREEACMLERRLYRLYVAASSEAPPFLRKTIVGAILHARSFASSVCSGESRLRAGD